MSPIGFGNTFGIASEFTNEIYDISNEANQAAVKEGGDTWTMILGIVVTLLPKVFHLYFDTILIFSNSSCGKFRSGSVLSGCFPFSDHSPHHALHCR